MDGEPLWRIWWRRGFAAFLGIALLVGLYVSYRPAGFSAAPEVSTEATTEPAPPGEGDGETASEATSEAASEAVADEDAMTKAEAEAFIEKARDPEETSVQVLDAGGGATATAEAAEALRELGYDVVAVNSSRTDYTETTVLFTEGNRVAAMALRAREERVATAKPNERLSDAVDLHLVIAPDWGG
jgi:hypothetical protein